MRQPVRATPITDPAGTFDPPVAGENLAAAAPVPPPARVRAAAIAAILLGGIGASLAGGIVFNGNVVTNVYVRVGEPTTVVLATTVFLAGPVLFALLILSGIRLWSDWKRVCRPGGPPAGREASVRTITSAVLRTRVLAGVTLVLGVVPFTVPIERWGQDGMLGSTLWEGDGAFGWFPVLLVGWVAGCGAVLMAARRAVWDLALSAGAAHAPGVGAAFEVLLPGLRPAGPAPSPDDGPVAAVPLTDAEVATGRAAAEGAAARETGAAPARDGPSGLRRAESVLLVALLVVLGTCVFRLPALFAEYAAYHELDAWRPVFAFYATGDTYFGNRLNQPVRYDAARGYAGVAMTACHLAVGAAAALAVVWAAWCLAIGPRARRAAVLVLWGVVGLAAARVGLALFLSGGLTWEMYVRRQSYAHGQRMMIVWILVFEAAVPAALLRLLYREPVKALFAFRPTWPRGRRRPEGGRPA